MKKPPSSNLQAPEKLQAPNTKSGRVLLLKFEVWNFSGGWSMEFGD
jgi:hypothetical protein